MEPNVIDTLRYADRLKEAGVESRQAEAMSRALNDELAGGVATKEDLDRTAAGLQGGLDALRADLDRAVVELKGEIAKVDAKVDAKFGVLNGKFETLDGKFDGLDGKFDGLDGKVAALDGKVAALDGKVDGLDGKVAALDRKFAALDGKFETQGRYMFLVLALIAALGLFNAVSPSMTSAAETGTSATTPAGVGTAEPDAAPGGPHR